MKNIVILFVILVLCSCSTDESTNLDTDTGLNVDFQTGLHLDVQAAKDYLPIEFFNEATIVYVNERNEELRMSTFSVESFDIRTHNGNEYKTDKFVVRIFDPLDETKIIFLDASTNLSREGDVVWLTLGAQLGHINVEHGNKTNKLIFENGQPMLFIPDYFRSSVDFLGRNFNDVFLSVDEILNQGLIESYSEIHLNSENGVVAFRDMENELWVFDRIEE